MSITQQPLTLEDYLAYDSGTETHYELVAGELVPMPPENRVNARIVMAILKAFMALLPSEQLSCKDTEIEVTGTRATVRLPDLMVLSQELVHLLEQRPRAIILRDMPPPLLVVEVVSPGKEVEDRDYRYKRSEYGARGIPEYWIVDPLREQILILTLVAGFYEVSTYRRGETLHSPTLPTLAFTVDQALGPRLNIPED